MMLQLDGLICKYCHLAMNQVAYGGGVGHYLWGFLDPQLG